MSEILDSVEKHDCETHQEDREKIKIENLREKHREQKLAYRERQREFFVTKLRFLRGDLKYKAPVETDITVLAKSLKSKSKISCELLNAIMNALIDSEENITAFLEIDGTLQVLMRLLSGQNEKYQMLAAECICNLALGNDSESMQVLKASESYLIAHLSGRNHYMKEVCATALGNLCTKGMQNVELLMKQGILLKIITLLNDREQTVEAAAVYALNQLIYYGFDILRPEEMEKCILAVIPVFTKRSFLVAFLMSLLSSARCTHPHLISNGIHFEALNHLLIALKEKEKESVYFLRIVSNLSVEESVVKDLIESHHFTIRECVRCLLQSEKKYLQKECLSWLGNFINDPMDLAKNFGTEIIKENFELIKLFEKTYEECTIEEMMS